jgi:hypothetical protein
MHLCVTLIFLCSKYLSTILENEKFIFHCGEILELHCGHLIQKVGSFEDFIVQYNPGQDIGSLTFNVQTFPFQLINTFTDFTKALY